MRYISVLVLSGLLLLAACDFGSETPGLTGTFASDPVEYQEQGSVTLEVSIERDGSAINGDGLLRYLPDGEEPQTWDLDITGTFSSPDFVLTLDGGDASGTFSGFFLRNIGNLNGRLSGFFLEENLPMQLERQ